MANINSRKIDANGLLEYATAPIVLMIAPSFSGSNDKTIGSELDEFRSAIINTGAVGEDQIAADAVTEPKLAANNTPTDGQVLSYGTTDGLTWKDDESGTGGISTIETDTTLDGSGTAADLLGISDGGVGTLQLSSGAVTQPKMADDSVGTDQVMDDAVTQAKMADDSVGTDQVIDGDITNNKLATGISGSKITTDILPLSVIPDLAASKITSGTLNLSMIPNLPASRITSGSFSTSRIPNLSASKIASGILNTDRIPDLNADKITLGTFPSGIRAGTPTRGSSSGSPPSGFDDSTRMATTEWVNDAMEAKVAEVVGGAPGQLDTLNELAAAINDDASYASTVTTMLALKAPLASPQLTGNPTAPTQSTSNDSARLATTAWVRNYAEEELPMGPRTELFTLDNDIALPASAQSSAAEMSSVSSSLTSDQSPSVAGNTILTASFTPKKTNSILSFGFHIHGTGGPGSLQASTEALEYRIGSSGSWNIVSAASSTELGEFGNDSANLWKFFTTSAIQFRIRFWWRGTSNNTYSYTSERDASQHDLKAWNAVLAIREYTD